MIEVHVNFPDDADARAIARTAVENRLAAAANVMPGVRSYYWWDGAVRSAEEVKVVFKTSEAVADRLVDYVGGAHPYRVPGIAVHKAIDVGRAYGNWVAEATEGVSE